MDGDHEPNTCWNASTAWHDAADAWNDATRDAEPRSYATKCGFPRSYAFQYATHGGIATGCVSSRCPGKRTFLRFGQNRYERGGVAAKHCANAQAYCYICKYSTSCTNPTNVIYARAPEEKYKQPFRFLSLIFESSLLNLLFPF